MKRKARNINGEDNRSVAIYTRKSRITNKGDSIGVRFKQSSGYAVNQLSLSEDYPFLKYEDKGLSGYYSDRPDFQRLLRDIEMGKIKAVACYKLDRVSRKTSDLMRLLEYFERHDVTLLVCSNNINTQIGTSKIIIQGLAIIAEFERDILTERIQDNLMEPAKDGRWLGGATPTGFTSNRVSTGSGKNKSAVSFLVSIEDEKVLVQKIYRVFHRARSIMKTVKEINKEYKTKQGANFTTSTIRLILKNPIYCTADEQAYNYFLEHDGNIFGELSEFDGEHGLSVYNKTDQCKIEDEDSTFFNPKFSQLLSPKPISEWIISVGKHEGFISSKEWIKTQKLLDAIAEKYNRPHRKTNALLFGLMYCPHCGKRLRVISESNRWTNGKPRFKYVCPEFRKNECTFMAVEGVTLDEYVVEQLSNLSEERSEYYSRVFEDKLERLIRSDQSEMEYRNTQKIIETLQTAIANQVRNMRNADEALQKYIEADIQEMSAELEKNRAAPHRMEEAQAGNQFMFQELNTIKKKLLSFAEYAKDAQPETLVTLINTVVERIYITTEGDKRICQIFIKGCNSEDYTGLFGAAEYIDKNAVQPITLETGMCDSDYYRVYTKA
ncbi:recombinase family protein [Pseudoramibacter faecis]|uniref:recombinase family protein n=1 Tax=Pseudoramibacter faecis TaxID=3108534 RepID=UPI002E7783B9|nr:recombinase family protein [Pseudoramibacter sp. HA2172]